MSDYLKTKLVNDPVLTTIAGKYCNASLIGEKLFPLVAVEKKVSRCQTFGKGRMVLYKTKRAVRANSNILLREKRAFTGRYRARLA